jgi:hypothetical protein
MIFWFLFIAIEITRNYILIEKLDMRPHYGYSRLIRFGFGAIFLLKAHPEFDPAGDVTTIFPAFNYGCFLASSFYLLFDPALNLLRKKPFWYKGKNSGPLDKLSKTNYYLLKAGTVVIFILSLIVIYGRS